MIGSIQKKGKIYYVVLPVGRDSISKRWKTKWIRVGPDEAEAETRLARIRDEYNQGRYREDEKMTVSQYLERWLKDYAKNSVRRSTYESYAWSITRHIVPSIGSVKLQKLRPLDIQGMLSEISATQLSATSVAYVYKVLNIALNRAIKWQILSRNPCIAVEPPRKEKYQARAYNKAELENMLTAAENTILRLPILLAAGCGLRRGEVCGLRWKDIMIDQKIMFIRNSLDRPESGKLTLLPVKTDNSERSVRLPEILLDELRSTENRQSANKAQLPETYHDQGFVFAWDNGDPFDPDYLDKAFRKFIQTKKLTAIRFHDLRHTHATLLLLEHVAVKVVSERLGHSSVNITQDIYSHVLPEMQKEAAAAIDRIFVEAAENKPKAPAPGKVINFADAQKLRAAKAGA